MENADNESALAGIVASKKTATVFKQQTGNGVYERILSVPEIGTVWIKKIRSPHP